MKLLTILFILIFTACQNSQSGKKNETLDTTNKLSQVQTKSNQEIKTVNNDLVPVKDTGQTWFRVKITRNDSAYLDFEGSWPVFFFHGNSGTLQMPKSKGLMTISPGISIYMNGMPTGKVPVVPDCPPKSLEKKKEQYGTRNQAIAAPLNEVYWKSWSMRMSCSHPSRLFALPSKASC